MKRSRKAASGRERALGQAESSLTPQLSPSQTWPSQSAESASRSTTRQARIRLNDQSGALIIYLVVMQLIGPAVAAALIVILQSMRKQMVSVDTVVSQIDGKYAGVMNLVCAATAFVFWIATHKRQIADPGPDGVFHRRLRRMTPWVLLGCMALLLTGQSLSTIYDQGFNWVIHRLSLRATTSSEMIEAASGSTAMFLYVSFFGPVVEEVVFRGVIMNSLKPYGKVFAIITSSTMFAFFHSDISQGLFAFCIGLVLGYVACEYSIFWSILLHIANNLLISNLGSMAVSSLPGPAKDWVDPVLLVGGLLLGALVLYLARGRVRGFILANRASKGIYASWGGLWFIVYLILQILVTAMEFAPSVS
ncbi:CAAX amino terminal protease family protein [Bifidobacterium actinocoloniiforme DSM 22766]|uniref:CAAX amino terminal protease family protein n=1 Tax=Bifidobacterium actinocoloniiforme DSM 22766 TaxID=1437605 RepID=A0A086YYU0_9BIFI|nr:type II CAAX endopeptidase family protein [Bifidobacterium actinocoloniiforme]AKV55956.1 hypothetical protein AB656_07195 [Bifidobacterium actinocoloniiforme DSM 22766]KFI39440.1 CAAX amino terminal protease family protein [Bifidobacterium actinocoloniiforme DSM 22766]